MPVVCKRVSGKWRLCEKNGRIVHSAKHDDFTSCKRQARAINANIELSLGCTYSFRGLSPFRALSLSTGVDGARVPSLVGVPDVDKKLVYRKELAYAGSFTKGDDPFEISEPLLHHWNATSALMLSNGVEIPVPLLHTDDPTMKRGRLVGSEVMPNVNGIPALYGFIRFQDEPTALQLSNADVSIYVVPEMKDGRGNSYLRPIRHVALTDYPVLPGLERFQALAASFEAFSLSSEPYKMPQAAPPSAPPAAPPQQQTPPLKEGGEKKEGGMDLLAVAQALGVPQPEMMQPDQLAAAVDAAIKAITTENQQLKQQAAMGARPPVAPMPGGPAAPPQMGMAPGIPQHLAASFTNMMKENRIAKLDQLVNTGCLDKAARDELEKQFCSDEALTLALSHVDSGNTDKVFEGVIAALTKNVAVSFKEKSGGQALALAHPSQMQKKKPQESKLVENAEKRAKEYEETVKK